MLILANLELFTAVTKFKAYLNYFIILHLLEKMATFVPNFAMQLSSLLANWALQYGGAAYSSNWDKN